MGTLAGSTSVTDEGTFTYAAPLPIPPGRAGMQPSLALAYASASMEGSLGVGFRIDGLSSMSRCGQSVAVDDRHRGVELDEEDRLCIDGARLLAVEGIDMAPGAVYRTEAESWRRVETVSADAAGVSGPVSFRVRMPDGRERLYGASEDSRLELTRPDGTRVVMSWFLTQERDPRGNAIRYTYDHVTPTLPVRLAAAMDPDPPLRDTVRISQIFYTGTASEDGTLGIRGTRSVRFSYATEPRIPDVGAPSGPGLTETPTPEDGFLEGTFGWRASVFPLERIRTFVGNELVHELRLVGDSDNAARRYRLSSAQLCANAPAERESPDGDLVCLPPTRFTWRDRRPYETRPVDPRYGYQTFQERVIGADPVRVEQEYPSPFVVLDANGDGADDIVYLGRSRRRRYPRLVIRLGGYTPREGASLETSPFGSETEVESSISDSDIRWLTSSEGQDQHRFHAMDWDSDGRDDIVFVGAGASGAPTLRVLRSLGAGRFAELDGGLAMPNTSFEVLDFDGDGRTDVAVCAGDASLGRWQTSDGPQSRPGRWQIARRAGGDFWHPWIETTAADRTDCALEYGRGLPAIIIEDGIRDAQPWESRPLVMDFDGDGAQELLFAAQIYDNPATPNGNESSLFMRATRWTGSAASTRPVDVLHGRYQVVDANGDGYHDLMTTHWALADGGDAPTPAPLLYISTGTLRPGTEQLAFASVPFELDPPGRLLERQRVSGGTGVVQREMLQFFSFDLAGDGRGDILAGTLPVGGGLPTRDLCGGRPTCEATAWNDAQFWVSEWLTTAYSQSFPTSFHQQGDWRANVGGDESVFYLTSQADILDADGDGALDVIDVQRVDATYTSTGNPLDRPALWGTRLLHNVRAQPALLERVTDGFGATTTVSYTPLSDATVYRASRDCDYPVRCNTDSRYVVQRVARDAGLADAGAVEETHFYAEGRTDMLGRGFLGFRQHLIRNLATGTIVDRQFDNRGESRDARTRSYPRAGRPFAVMTYGVVGAPGTDDSTVFVGSREDFSYQLVTTDVGTRYVTTTRTRSQSYEEVDYPPSLGGPNPFAGLTAVRDVTARMTYDAFGNPFVTREQIAGISDEVVSRSSWINDTDQWRIGLPDTHISRTNESDGACSLETRSLYTVDVALAEITAVQRTGRRADPSMERNTRVLERDRFGNITRLETSSAADSRSIEITYEPTGYFVDTVENALGHLTDIDVEARFGQVHHATDPNGIESARSFDGFGRVRVERTAGRGGAEITYDLADPTGRHQVRVDPDEGGHEVVEYDRLGRAVDSYTDHAYLTSRVHREFDLLGRVTEESEPFTGTWDPTSSGTPRTTHVFDDLGRLQHSIGPDGERVDYDYPRNARRVTRAGEGARTTELDAAGRVLAAVEPGSTGGTGGRTTYQYCRSGLLRRTFDPRGNVTTVEYDDLGRRTFLEDPAAGISRFSYTGLDELARTEDAAGRVTQWTRDDLGRVTAMENLADGTIDRFFFDTAVTPSGRPVLGALGSTQSGDGVIDSFEYDDLVRPRAQTRLVDGRLLRTEDTLDEFGRVSRTTLPDSLGFGATTISNQFDPASGEPIEVQVNGAPLWRLDGQDPHGMPTSETLGAPSLGLLSRQSAYSAGGRLESLRSMTGSTALQDLSYAYEPSGRVQARTDLVASRTEQFAYDQLSRLTDVLEGSVVRQHYESDEIGNLTETHDGSLIYADPTRPYAATEVAGPGGERFGYDDVGNADRVGDLTITYTQRNLPRTVSSSKTGVIQYTYDAGGARATKRGRDVDVTYFGLYELERRGMVLYERISLPTPVGVVAQLERVAPAGANNPERLRWLLADRQGSVETTWLPGQDPEHHRYDAYGGVLSESGALTGDRPTPTVSAGYTGHEHEQEVGLVNMSGRIYSPRLRRFLSADPIVAVPYGQGLNAYTYVMGDPMNWTDPTGWYREQPGYTIDRLRDAYVMQGGPTGAYCVDGGQCDYEAEYVIAERGGAGAAGQATAAPPDRTDSMAILSDWSNRYAGFTETLFNIIPNAVPENELSPARWVHAASEWGLSRRGSDVELFDRRSREYGQGEVAAILALLYIPVVGPLYAEENAAAHAAAMSGEVVYRPNATMSAADREAMDRATQAFQASLEAGHMHPDGRRPTKGPLRDSADRAAARERRRAIRDEEPYVGAAGHNPDTTWSGEAEPPGGWIDVPHSVNSSMGAQSQRYPIGYRPTGFRYTETEVVFVVGPFGEPLGHRMSL